MNVLGFIKKIGVVTATRAEYGLLVPLLKLLKNSDNFDLRLFVTGTHLSHEFGFTKKNIINDKFEICEEIDSVVSNDTSSAIGKTSALTLMGLVDAYERQKPDILVLLGDRFEMLCAAVAANICRIPIAHIHGGEITEGAYDDNFRHAITKLSHLHFTSCDEHRKRVIQLGEKPDYVFDVGALGIENIKSLKFLSKNDLENNLGIKFKKINLMVTVHPETLVLGNSESNINLLLKCLEKLEDTFVIFTGANADSEGRVINNILREASNKSDSFYYTENLGLLRYVSTLNVVDAVIGNSSSGLIEVPSFNIPTVNIGDRQKGRLRADSVIDVPWDSDSITKAIKKALTEKYKEVKNPYGDGDTAKKIVDKIGSFKDLSSLLHKEFYNISSFKEYI